MEVVTKQLLIVTANEVAAKKEETFIKNGIKTKTTQRDIVGALDVLGEVCMKPSTASPNTSSLLGDYQYCQHENKNSVREIEMGMWYWPEWLNTMSRAADQSIPLGCDYEEFDPELYKKKSGHPIHRLSKSVIVSGSSISSSDEGRLPLDAISYRDFVIKFEKLPKLKEFNKKFLYQYPEGDAWRGRIVNLNSYPVIDQRTLNFICNDPDVEEEREDLVVEINHIYSLLKSIRMVPEYYNTTWTYELSKDVKVGVVDLGHEGFHRCMYDLTRYKLEAHEIKELYVLLVDEIKNRVRLVSSNCIYPCLEDLGLCSSRIHEIYLNQLDVLNYPWYIYRKEMMNYLKEIKNLKCKVVVCYWIVSKRNGDMIPVVDLYTLDSPPMYVNELLVARVISALPGPKLPPAGEVCDACISQLGSTGEVALQIETYELHLFDVITNNFMSPDVRELLQEYRRWWGASKLDKTTIYYAEYYMNSEFYRARLLTLEPEDLDTDDYNMRMKSSSYTSMKSALLAYFIDYGNIDYVNPDMLIPVECVDPMLVHFKPQAIMAQLNTTSDVKEILEDFIDTQNSISIEVIRTGENCSGPNGKNLPILDVVLSGGERALELDVIVPFLKKTEWVSQRDRKQEALDSMTSVMAIDLKTFCWTRPPQTPLVLEPGVNILMTITHVFDPNSFILQPSENTEQWDRMEDELTRLKLSLDPYAPYLVEDIPDYSYENFYCWWCEQKKKFFRIMYIEQETGKIYICSYPGLRSEEELSENVIVYLVDIAQFKEVRKWEVKTVPFPRFALLSPKSIQGSISQTKNWTKGEINRFKNNVLGKTFCFRILAVKYSADDDVELAVPQLICDMYDQKVFDEAYESKQFYEVHQDELDPALKIPLWHLGLGHPSNLK